MLLAIPKKLMNKIPRRSVPLAFVRHGILQQPNPAFADSRVSRLQIQFALRGKLTRLESEREVYTGADPGRGDWGDLSLKPAKVTPFTMIL